MLTVNGTHQKLPDIIRAHLYVESIKESRQILIHLIALGGGLLWLCTILPRLLPHSILILAEVLWPVFLGVFALILFLELRAKARIARLLREKNESPAEFSSADSGLPEGE